MAIIEFKELASNWMHPLIKFSIATNNNAVVTFALSHNFLRRKSSKV